jgi:hypothetical protein
MAYSGLLKTGTVAVSVGSPVVTGTGATWKADSVVPGGKILIAGEPLPHAIKSVDSDTQITLEDAITTAAGSGKAYAIEKLAYEATVVAILAKLLTQLNTSFDLDGADKSVTLDTDTGGLWLAFSSSTVAPTGRFRFGIMPGDLDTLRVQRWTGSAWSDVASAARATGGVSFGRPDLARTALGLDACGFRNRIRNPSFAINQRGKTGTIVLAAGAYGHDGVKAGANGATYTASTAGLDTTLTITAGSLILPIEYVLIEGGSYVLSQAGTAPARVWQGTGTSGSGSYAAAPFAVTGLAAATQTDVEFGVGTVLRPQFEPGTLATAFERRPTAIELELCQRYFQKSYSAGVAPGTATAVGAAVTGSPTVNAYSLAAGYLPVEMRAVPTVVYYALNGEPGKVSYWTTGLNPTTSFTSGPGNSSRAICAQLVNVTDATMIYFHYTASAEI